MQHSTDEDLNKLPHILITSDEIWDPTVLDHLIDIENDIYHPVMDPTVDEENFVSFDECTSMTRTYLHHDSYSPNFVWDVYHNECMNYSGFDSNTGDNTWYSCPQCLLNEQDYKVLCPYLLWLHIACIKQTL